MLTASASLISCKLEIFRCWRIEVYVQQTAQAMWQWDMSIFHQNAAPMASSAVPWGSPPGFRRVKRSPTGSQNHVMRDLSLFLSIP